MTDCYALKARGDSVTIYDEACATEISQARNQIIDAFLHSDATDLVFVDDDVFWQEGALLKLLDYPVDCVAGVYRKRIDQETYSIRWLRDRPNLIADESTGLLEVEAVPGGFVRMSRHMLTTMEKHYSAELMQLTTLAIEGKWTALCDPLWRDNGRLSEDFSLCMRWRDIGGTVWVDPEINMGHCGMKAFSGTLGNWLRNR
ncbi:MAG: hypothetical protein GY807_21055 [Gammaproteobacteria bacterium]|nr:hypothetical protein [Gammaproteobacteria bacterium]